ncbi:MAG TPA: DUF2381 family protein, partial [Archangium sp.]|nr:DUF2381 family protein [Archangium sp.]
LLPWWSFALLVMGTTVAAEPASSARERLECSVVVVSRPGEPVPEVRAAAGVTTWLRFDAPIDRESLELDGLGARVRLVDVGEHTVAVELLQELEPGRRLSVRVRYRDGAAPQQAVLALVSHPTQVDKEVEVVRRPAPPVVLNVEGGGPGGSPEQGDTRGLRATRFRARIPPGNTSGLKVRSSEGYRTTSHAFIRLVIRNLPGQKPWTLGAVRFSCVDGTAVGVRHIRLDKSPLQPGDTGEVVVETEAPVSSQTLFQLELMDSEGGRPLSLEDVELKESQQ